MFSRQLGGIPPFQFLGFLLVMVSMYVMANDPTLRITGFYWTRILRLYACSCTVATQIEQYSECRFHPFMCLNFESILWVVVLILLYTMSQQVH